MAERLETGNINLGWDQRKVSFFDGTFWENQIDRLGQISLHLAFYCRLADFFKASTVGICYRHVPCGHLAIHRHAAQIC